MKIVHWAIIGRDTRDLSHQEVNVHSVGSAGDTFEITGQVPGGETYVTITLTRDEYDLFLSMQGLPK